MNLYQDYFRCEGFETLEIPEIAFCTYKIEGLECYLRDIYVKPEFREKHTAVKLADLVVKIAKSNNCKYFIGTVNPLYKDANISRKMLKSYGMTLFAKTPISEIYYKEI